MVVGGEEAAATADSGLCDAVGGGKRGTAKLMASPEQPDARRKRKSAPTGEVISSGSAMSADTLAEEYEVGGQWTRWGKCR